jgi:hypothetical protein
MNNKELGNSISAKEFKKSSTALVKNTELITGIGADTILTILIGCPFYSLLKPFIDGVRDWKSRVELKQLAYFLKEFENLDQNERSIFSLMIQENEEDFTERLFYYISQLNDKRKAVICGKLGVSYAHRKITSEIFLRLIEVVKSANYKDLYDLKKAVEGPKNIELPDKNPEREEQFKSAEFFKDLQFLNKNEILKSNLRSLNLVDSRINLDSLQLPSKNISMGSIQEALRNVLVIECFSDFAFLLYEFGLKKIEM